jgi:type I restriction enzyme S subunit
MSWKRVLIGDIAIEDRSIVLPDSEEAANRPYLGLEQIEPNTGQILSYDLASAEGKSTTFAFDEAHVLYGKLRPYLNKVALPDRKGRCSTEIIPLKPNGVDRNLLAVLLRTEKVINAVMSEKTGSRMPRADMDVLFGVEVTIPESEIEQARIVARLGAQVAEVVKARLAAVSQLQDAALLPHRILSELFLNDTNDEPTTLDTILVDIQAGKSFQTAETLAGPDELGVLKVSAVTWTDFRPNEAKALKDVYDPADSHKVKNGDFIISRANTKEFVGAVVLVDRDYPNRLLSDKTLRLVVNETRVCKEFLLFALRTSTARRHIEHFATGTSDSMRNISQGTITSIPLCLPELNEQRRLATQLKERMKEVTEVRSSIEAQLQEIEKLPNSILAQAFES